MPNPCENGVCLIPVRMEETAQMELMNTFVPVFLDTLEQTVKQVNCCKLYCKNISFHMFNDCIFQILNTENHYKYHNVTDLHQ